MMPPEGLGAGTLAECLRLRRELAEARARIRALEDERDRLRAERKLLLAGARRYWMREQERASRLIGRVERLILRLGERWRQRQGAPR